MKYNLNGKKFKPLSNTDNGDAGKETIFSYHQKGSRVWADYAGGSVIHGNLLAIQDSNGCLDMYYQHINTQNKMMIGRCTSVPSLTSEGKIQLHENWQWLNGDQSEGESTIVEI